MKNFSAFGSFIRNAITGSADLLSAPPILARTNNRNSLNCLHVEKIAIDADQERAFTRDRGAQHRYIATISADIRWQISRLYDKACSTKKGGDLTNVALGIAEFLNELSRQFRDDKFRNHQLVV